MLTQKGPVLGTWTGGTFSSYSLLTCMHGLCAVGTVSRLHTLPWLSTAPEIGVTWAAPFPGRLMVAVVPASWWLPSPVPLIPYT